MSDTFQETPETEEEEGSVLIPDADDDPEVAADFEEADPTQDPILSTPTAESHQAPADNPEQMSPDALGTFTCIALTGDVIEMKDKQVRDDITVLIDTSNNEWAVCPEDPQCVEPFDAEKHTSTGSSASTGDAEAQEHANLGNVDATEQADLEKAVSEGTVSLGEVPDEDDE